jgi:hypothetical protein
LADEQADHVEFLYREAPGYRIATADSAVIVQIFDGVGTTLKVTFTRLDPAVSSETVRGSKVGEGIQITGPGRLNVATHKMQEVSVLLRPDHAYNIAKAVFENLGRLELPQLERYRLSQPIIQAITDALTRPA